VTDLLELADPFFGNGTIDLPPPEGIAATWFFIKAQTGNTHPGATTPFGMVSVCAYSGAYPTGYGLNAPNTHGTPARRFDHPVASGFAHLHQSGTGMIDTYYNYVRVTPLVSDLGQLGTLWPLRDEVASPGYYAVTLGDTGIRAELTASLRSAIHRYTFPVGSAPRIAVDLSAGGIDFPGMRTVPTAANIVLVGSRAAQGWLELAGLRLYVHVEIGSPATSALWLGDRHDVLAGRRSLAFGAIAPETFEPFGAVFDLPPAAGSVALVRVGFSLRSVQQAQRNAQGTLGRTFDAVLRRTQDLWRNSLGRMEVAGGHEHQRRTFYSALYHSLQKPSNWEGESPSWDSAPYYVDFATLWDQYKTQLPLLMTFFPGRGCDAVNTLLSLAERWGYFPNAFLLDADRERCNGQARALAHTVIADAFHRRIDGIDWLRAYDVMEADLAHPRNRAFFETGAVEPPTHTLDLAYACFCTAQLARALGRHTRAATLLSHAANWRTVYDRATGRLVEGTYYEGGLWNYSFRLLHDMAGRIALYPTEEAFVADLDRFFGYGQPPVVQPTDPNDKAAMAAGLALNRFEGYNNEPDIEVPYAYLYAGRPDRTAEVVRAGMRSMFTTGRGGLPGNNDSGGLTSCYVWNALGLFPVTGQPVFLIGSPIFDGAGLQVGEKTFTIEVDDNGDDAPYVQSAELNGQPIDRAYLTVDEVMAGSTLHLRMGREPSAWGRTHRPPSYPGNRLPDR